MQPKCHEFWLKRYPEKYGILENAEVYRVALGELMDASQRKTFPPPDGSHDPDFWNKTGSIGFMDIMVADEYVPKRNATPYPNPNQSPFLEHQYDPAECEYRRALVIKRIGIEPDYRGRGNYAGLLKQRAEELALEWDLDTIVCEWMQNQKLRELVGRWGYLPYDGGFRAVKRIMVS